jgi:hypothetical protein
MVRGIISRQCEHQLSQFSGGIMTKRLEPYSVEAYNTAKLSENKMHDDSVARKFGFVGGLVPGVDVLAYMIHPPVLVWGRDFLERGLIEARFTKPVYDGETVQVIAEEAGGGLDLRVEGGDIRATGTASLTARPDAWTSGSVPRRGSGQRMGSPNISARSARRTRCICAKGWCIPACCSGS